MPDINEIKQWLNHGADLATELKGDKASHRDIIWLLISEAIQVIDNLPDKDRHWLKGGQMSGVWPGGISLPELLALEREKILSGINPFEVRSSLNVQPKDIDRAFGVINWLRWLNDVRNGEILKKCAVALAKNGESPATIKYVLEQYPASKMEKRKIIYDIKSRTIGHILAGLSRNYNLVPTKDLSFTEESVNAA